MLLAATLALAAVQDEDRATAAAVSKAFASCVDQFRQSQETTGQIESFTCADQAADAVRQPTTIDMVHAHRDAATAASAFLDELVAAAPVVATEASPARGDLAAMVRAAAPYRAAKCSLHRDAGGSGTIAGPYEAICEVRDMDRVVGDVLNLLFLWTPR